MDSSLRNAASQAAAPCSRTPRCCAASLPRSTAAGRLISTLSGSDHFHGLREFRDFLDLLPGMLKAAFQAREGVVGGGLVVLDDDSVLVSTGDNGDAGEDGRDIARPAEFLVDRSGTVRSVFTSGVFESTTVPGRRARSTCVANGRPRLMFSGGTLSTSARNSSAVPTLRPTPTTLEDYARANWIDVVPVIERVAEINAAAEVTVNSGEHVALRVQQREVADRQRRMRAPDRQQSAIKRQDRIGLLRHPRNVASRPVGMERQPRLSGCKARVLASVPRHWRADGIAAEPEPGFLEGVRDLCDRHGAVLIFDEVMTGFRVHLRGAQGLYDVVPDLTTLGKVIGGGMPVGAFGGRRAIMERIAPLGVRIAIPAVAIAVAVAVFGISHDPNNAGVYGTNDAGNTKPNWWVLACGCTGASPPPIGTWRCCRSSTCSPRWRIFCFPW